MVKRLSAPSPHSLAAWVTPAGCSSVERDLLAWRTSLLKLIWRETPLEEGGHLLLHTLLPRLTKRIEEEEELKGLPTSWSSPFPGRDTVAPYKVSARLLRKQLPM